MERKLQKKKKERKRPGQAEWLGILSLRVSKGNLQCVLIHPAQRALKRGFPIPANKSLPLLHWYSGNDSQVFVL